MKFFKSSLIATFICLLPLTSWSVDFDLKKGCSIIAEKRRSVGGNDAVSAGYCAGVIDGILITIAHKQAQSSIPDPCFEGRNVDVHEVAKSIVTELDRNPKIMELVKADASGRPSFAAFISMALAYQCEAK